ncbi:MAG: hypothetical protein HN390_14955 [Anaerolineae bacterium]|jgi:hypothetical protein|nr:hypothetical protein [Anaerolineae bacterium]MBT7190966.1 hypothetical protein [Anaerolineae bacterium]MBT7989923.1 hypothetical protein [Anaerolineae bacterium]
MPELTFTDVLGLLGIYAALMAVLAIVVEAIISWFKIPIPWLQGKPSPEVVLKEVKGWLDEKEANYLLSIWKPL